MEEVKYLTDDRDYMHQATICLYRGGNGDYYQQVEWKEDGLKRQSPAIRVCTSGGASTQAPHFMRSVADQYHALSGELTSTQRVSAQRDKAIDMLQKVLDGEVSRDEVEFFIAMNRV